ncbi:FHA domain-containing protein [Streptomyces sp. H51]|uniref:FHA domain-containing protein n=1 Tax=Streptomyces sp. H51 TaxID=3111770 RepID=UPI002D7736E3|nr:FHA domain-containing protein [Streptomyces sp. H51]
MQIRLTVVDPLGPPDRARGRTASRDVLVTAPAGTALAAVASALASAVSGDGSAAASGGAPVLYAGAERLDDRRSTLGEPPLTDGAVLSLGAPADPGPHPEPADAPTQLHVVAGPDAGGVHLLHGGEIRIGRSADADVPLDDPDVSRLHCAVTVAADGRVSVADLGSTNGTVLDGSRVDARPVPFTPGGLLRIGESALRVAPAARPQERLVTAPDGEGHIRVPSGADRTAPGGSNPDGAAGQAPAGSHARVADGGDTSGVPREAPGALGHAPVVPEQGGAPRIESSPPPPPSGPTRYMAGDTHAGHAGHPGAVARNPAAPAAHGRGPDDGATGYGSADDGSMGHGATGYGSAAHGSAAHGSVDHGSVEDGARARGGTAAQGARRRGGLTAWARRLAGGRGEQAAAADGAYGAQDAPGAAASPPAGGSRLPETWPDPAALLLTALGPGPRLWERGPGHPETLTVRLGTADRLAPDGSGLLPAVPVTANLREAGALGLAGPRTRLSGLARAVVAQLAALHSPELLEIVLISADRSRPVQERAAEWSWLGWLPHARPAHGQDCRLLLAYDHDQAAARTDELLRRLEDRSTDARPGVPAPGLPAASRAAARRPSWARDDDEDGADRFTGPYTVVVVDGDPGSSAVREAVSRLALAGPAAGIHVVCLAETESAPPAAPVTETYEAACAVAPAFRDCGAVALLSGDVATALRLMRVARTAPAAAGRPAPGLGTGSGSGAVGRSVAAAPPHAGPVGPGTTAAVDAVSLAWAERFARALAPLRPDGSPAERHPRVSVPLPQAARLLDELGLARATPASLMARWADAADDADSLGGRAWAVLGAGPRGPVCADLAADGPHLLVEGPAGSGRTELLRAVVASLAAAERPDRLGIVLIDGRDGAGAPGGTGEGLRVCTDVPHVTTHLTANDPVRMREFAQSLSAELKRRAELLGRCDFAEWHAGRAAAGRIVPQRAAVTRGAPAAAPGTAAVTPGAAAVAPGAAALAAGGRAAGPSGAGAADLDTPPSSTLRLRPAAARRRAEDAPPPLPRLVVVVDDLDALVSPALGSPGRPAAGSVMRALEAVAREGERLGVHLVTAAGPGGRTAETEPVRRATLRVTLDAPGAGPDQPAPGRGRLTWADERPATAFQGGRVTGRIPRTATLRPTVVPLDWQRMGDPPARRPVRELGNGPTDLALLASALERAAREVSAAHVPSLL